MSPWMDNNVDATVTDAVNEIENASWYFISAMEIVLPSLSLHY